MFFRKLRSCLGVLLDLVLKASVLCHPARMKSKMGTVNPKQNTALDQKKTGKR